MHVPHMSVEIGLVVEEGLALATLMGLLKTFLGSLVFSRLVLKKAPIYF